MALARSLHQGYASSGQTVYEARRGKVFQKNGIGFVTLNAGNPEDYQRLLQSLGENFPQQIIYAWDFRHDGEISSRQALTV